MARTWVPVPDGSPFPLTALPYGVLALDGAPARPWVAVGDHAVDLGVLEQAGVFRGTGLAAASFAGATLNAFVAQGPEVWSAVRARLVDVLSGPAPTGVVDTAVVERRLLRAALPVAVGDYVDFYSSLHHATNLGRLFRPGGEALLPNWRHLPVGYHGRSGTLVPDGDTVWRPSGLRLVDGEVVFGPTRALDIELEVGAVVGVGSERGRPVAADDAGRHLFGLCLVNDWSARDIQSFEYQPLGPFLGKSFATSVSPWLVPLEALEPFRCAGPEQHPPVAGYLRTSAPWGFDLHLEVHLRSAAMCAAGQPAVQVSAVSFADMYWSFAQQLAHLTVNGASVRPGDLLASGTVSGADPGSEGSLIERTWGGTRPFALPDGSERTYLLDGDEVELRGWAGTGPGRIGLGSVRGTVQPSPQIDEEGR